MDKTTRGDWRKVREVFEDSLLQPEETRRQYARQLCDSDEILWDEVRSLLEWHESSESFLETPAVVQVVESDPVRNQLVAGQQIRHYEITKLIGEGGMGEVYLARDKRLDRNVAIKLLRGDLLPHVRGRERLLREARAVALLEHPNICHIYEISESDGFSFIVMQYVVGTTLDEIFAVATLDASTVLDLAAQIADGLAEAHSQGIIHRDIKPANIIISNKGQAKILDFGLAKAIEGENGPDGISRMESSGGVMGTIPYMSPEQLSGQAVDARTDVFSFGSLLFELISGTSAFGRQRNEDTVYAILNDEPDWSLVSPLVRPFLARCLAKDRDNRYASGHAVAEALSEVRKAVRMASPTASRPAQTTTTRSTTDESELETVRYSMYATQAFGFENSPPSRDSADAIDDGADHQVSKSSHRFPAFWKTVVAGISAVAFSAGIFGYYFLSASDPIGSGSPTGPPRQLYWELSYTNKRKFVRNRVMQIQALIGDDQRGITDESLDGIRKEVDWYVRRRDSLSQEPFDEGLRIVFGRASQYVAMVSAEFDKEKIPTAVGIYQALIESEYRDCLMSDTGPVGLFQFTKDTAQQYGLAAHERCRVDLSSKAAAAFNSRLLDDLGREGSSWTLAVLSFDQGVELTRSEIAALRELGVNEKNYWVIKENRARLSNYASDSDGYVSRFFAAAIIGENPEMFGLVTPPLSTIRTRVDLGFPNQNAFINIPGGTFTMGHNDSTRDVEKPEHQESVDGFRMNKSEVTNTEFADFISATGYKPEPNKKSNFLAHWVNGLPLDSDENTPVRFVNLADINAFIEWKSKVDGIQYRLPTEKEWEYAARNGRQNNLYPWGDRFDARCAFIDQERNEPVAVGTRSCPNMWGIQDLIGNVFEWTATPMGGYPGSSIEVTPQAEVYFMIRGGGAFDKSIGPNAITSTFRHPIPGSRRSPGLGFRLVTSQ